MTVAGSRPLRSSGSDLAAEIADDIRSQILSGKLRPGDSMPTTVALTESYGVSPPTMRAALRLLEAEGLVRVHRGVKGGPRVQALDVTALARQAELHMLLDGANLENLFETLLLIQPGAVELAAERRTPEQIEALYAAIEPVRTATTQHEFMDAGIEFVVLLQSAAGNPALTLLGQLLLNLIKDEARREIGDAPVGTVAGDVADHYGEVVRMVELGLGEVAAALWRAHLFVMNPYIQRETELREESVRGRLRPSG